MNNNKFVAHDGITIWEFGTTEAEADAEAKFYSEDRFDPSAPDNSIDRCGPRLWSVRDSMLDPSSGWSVDSDMIVELD